MGLARTEPVGEARTLRSRLAALHRIIACNREVERADGLLLLRGLLSALTAPYGAGIWLRNAAFDCRLRRAHRVPARVVSVGNLSVGGTGKTPLVAALARASTAAGRRPAILTRGYAVGAGEGDGASDEARLFERLVPGVPVVVDPDRVRGARAAIAAGADLLLLDDGFQHRRLARDADIVLLDARDPFCGGLLPRGRLREPRSSLRRAGAIVLTRCERATADELQRARAAVAACTPPGCPVREAEHAPVAVQDAAGREVAAPASLRGLRVLAFSGLGDPDALPGSLARLGAEVAARRDFADHHPYTAAELAALARATAAAGAACAVTTEKDLMRIAAWPGPQPLRALRIEMRLRDEDRERLLAVVGIGRDRGV
jgi:tetraacyldisaccharide 4'-kinase